MPLDISESIPLGRFIYDTAWTPLKGAYILPLRFFAPDRTLDPNDYLEVIKVVDVAGTNVAITRGGGLFVRDKGQYQSRQSIEGLVSLFNLLSAEFALLGLASHPLTDIELQSAKLIGRHASITGGWGSFADRTWGPYVLLAMQKRDLGAAYGSVGNDYWPANFYWVPVDPGILDRVSGVPNALKLRTISPTLPALLVAAAYHTMRHDLAEGIVTSWIVCEELISFLWDAYIGEIREKERRDHLNDSRTYTAAVQIETLLVVGKLDSKLAALLQEARRLRNALAHRATMSQEAVDTCNQAMRALLTHLGIPADRLPGFTYQSGGIGSPVKVLEPEFRFE